MIERTEYLELLKRFKDKDLIKVVTGIRRCGKSTLFDLYINYLKKIGIKEDQIIKINLEDVEYSFETYKELYDYVNEKLDTKKQYYVFLDEVQNVPMFQKAVDSLYIKKNVDVYITGSNAYLLSGELATLLSGRYIEIKMLPLSFKEYLSAFNEPNKSRYEYFLDYMKNGGMPGNISILKDNPNDLDKYLEGIFSTIVYKDILARNNITDKINEAVTVEKNSEGKEDFNINFNTLKKQNEDTVAWIKVNNTNVKYPVVKAKDNSFYLTHSFDKSNNSAGWIFADYKNKFDDTDKNIVIYGHNRRDGSMFSSLKNALNPNWYNNDLNRNILLYTENEEYNYEIFSIYKIESEDYYIKTEFNDENDFEDFLNTITKRSVQDFGVNVSKDDSILTLSTCANNNKYRVVIHAKKVIMD